jgi:type IV pilus modification protein PilV
VTEHTPPARGTAGFTLIEVLIAMVILAVGLLALESMGIGASRMVARAQVQSEYAAIAADTLERTLNRIRGGAGAAVTQTWTVSRGATASLVTTSAVVNTGGAAPLPSLWTVTVTITPPTTGILRASDGVTLRSNVIQ